MNKINYIFLLFFLYFSTLSSQSFDSNLSYLTIPDSLKTNANAVIRYENTHIELVNRSKMVTTKEMVVTVLNKHGDGDGYIDLYYNNHRKINSVSAKIYDTFGREIKKIKRSDFKDVSAADGFSLYSDSRVLYYNHIALSYPYTIQYTYKTTTSNTAFIPQWLPIKHFYASTQKSVFTLTYPKDIVVNLKEFHLSNYEITNNSSENKHAYTLKNAIAIKYERLSPTFYSYGPHVKFAANKFHLAGVDGQADDWIGFGKWWSDNLLVGRNNIPESTKNEVINLVKNVKNLNEKIRLIYEYMQNKTRYISVQIGIGGWEPMFAGDVDRLGYGDCKALSNYTYSLLKTVNIPSYYTKIYAGEGKRSHMTKDLVSQQSNHVILMVPTKKDTIWLECTNQKVPFGYLGTFTDDRDALVITPEGGKIIHTKAYTNTESLQLITAEYTLDENGHISAKAKIKSSGIQYDDHYHIADYDLKKKEEHYKDFFSHINNIQIKNTSVHNDNLNTVFTEDIHFTANNYAVNSGDRMLVRLNAFNTNSNIPKRYRNRKLPLEIQYGFMDMDTVTIYLPKNYTIEAMGNGKEVTTKFGTYKITAKKIKEHQIEYTRKLLIKQGMYSVEDYGLYRKFRKKINQLDNSKIVLIKNQQP